MKLIWSPEALDDLLSIRDYITRESPDVAIKVVSIIATTVEKQLSQFPRTGRAGRVDGTLELVIPRLPFIVPYRITKPGIDVLRVYHTSRQWPDSF
ncbi:MAG: type II toxin-antitoxin system RelE/ParE family toxin [Bacteroidetes bacterium]|nr:type II toxin-antitoxin system RelE/ParE family toxin [Bacteroidota bacterium]